MTITWPLTLAPYLLSFTNCDLPPVFLFWVTKLSGPFSIFLYSHCDLPHVSCDFSLAPHPISCCNILSLTLTDLLFHVTVTCPLILAHFLHFTNCESLPVSGDCYLAPDPGPCRAAEKRYHFDPAQGDCVAFYYGGCEGNGNNFFHYQDCIAMCTKGKVLYRIIIIVQNKQENYNNYL